VLRSCFALVLPTTTDFAFEKSNMAELNGIQFHLKYGDIFSLLRIAVLRAYWYDASVGDQHRPFRRMTFLLQMCTERVG
jgi:hypothetical protein